MGAEGGRAALAPALGLVRGTAGGLVTVEMLPAQGGSVTVDAQAIHTAAYAPGDRVLVVFAAGDLDAALVVGRVGVVSDVVDPAALLRADGTRPLSADWDAGAGRTIALDALRARSAAGLALADDGGALGLCVADGGNVGVGVSAPQGRLHVWDGAGGFLIASRTNIGASAQVLIPNGAGDVTLLVRGEAVVSNGAAAAYAQFTFTPGGVMTQSTALSSDSYQFRLNADGSLDVRRTAGTNAGAVTARLLWA